MSTDVRDVIAQVIKAHNYPGDRRLRQSGDELYYLCECGEHISVMVGTPSHHDHLAEVLVEKLGLTRETVTLNEYAAANGEPPQRKSRWVSGWSAASE